MKKIFTSILVLVTVIVCTIIALIYHPASSEDEYRSKIL